MLMTGCTPCPVQREDGLRKRLCTVLGEDFHAHMQANVTFGMCAKLLRVLARRMALYHVSHAYMCILLARPACMQDNIPQDIIDALQPLLTQPDFQPAKIKKVSQAASGLCAWVRAMDSYNRVAKVVAPKRAALRTAEAELGEVMKALMLKQAELAGVAARLKALQDKLDAARSSKAALEEEVRTQCRRRGEMGWGAAAAAAAACAY